jgi:hypothetical protein
MCNEPCGPDSQWEGDGVFFVLYISPVESYYINYVCVNAEYADSCDCEQFQV